MEKKNHLGITYLLLNYKFIYVWYGVLPAIGKYLSLMLEFKH